MKNMKEIRFVATNYLNLQGLRTIPVSLLLILVVLWANGSKYPISAAGWLTLIIEVVVMAAAYFGIGQYYRHAFGQIKRTPETLRLEWLTSIVFVILTLAAFWLDGKIKLPISLLGLVFGLLLLTDYMRITWLVKGKYLLYYPIGAVLIVVVSLLPLFGLPGWWHAVGLRSQIFAIALVIGIYMIIAGIWGQLYLVRTLSPKEEEK